MHRRAAANHKKLSDDFTDRLMQRIQDDEKKKHVRKRQQVWMYTSIAAAVALLMGFFFYFSHSLISKPAERELVEREDSTNILQEIERMERETPRHPMAQMNEEQGTRIEEQGTKIAVRKLKKSTVTQPSIPPAADEEPLLADAEETDPIATDTMLRDTIYYRPDVLFRDYAAYYEQVQQQIRAHIEDVDKSIEESISYFKGY